MRHHRHHQDTKATVLSPIPFEGTARPCYTKAADGIGDYVANFGKSPGLPNGGGRGNSPPLPITATTKPSPSISSNTPSIPGQVEQPTILNETPWKTQTPGHVGEPQAAFLLLIPPRSSRNDVKSLSRYCRKIEGTARSCYIKAAHGIGDYVANVKHTFDHTFDIRTSRLS